MNKVLDCSPLSHQTSERNQFSLVNGCRKNKLSINNMKIIDIVLFPFSYYLYASITIKRPLEYLCPIFVSFSKACLNVNTVIDRFQPLFDSAQNIFAKKYTSYLCLKQKLNTNESTICIEFLLIVH